MHTTIHTRRQARTTCALFAATTIAAAAPALAQAMHAPGDSTSQTPHEQPLSSEPAAGVAKADTLSHGTTAQERKALLIRSEALNRRYP